MANANVRIFKGHGAEDAAETFIETVDDAKIIAVTGWAIAGTPTIMVTYKT